MNTTQSQDSIFNKLRRPLVVLVVMGILLLPGGFFASASTSGAAITPQNKALIEEQKQWMDPQASVDTEVEARNPGTNPFLTPDVRQQMAAAPAPDSAMAALALPNDAGGRWSRLPTLPANTNAYHVTMGPGGKMLLIAGSGNSSAVFKAGTFKAFIWDPRTGIKKTINVPEDMFCAGHMLMSNGQALIAGGTTNYSSPWKGETALYTFNFSTEKFTKRPNMNHGRWYPTVVSSPAGWALIVGGLNAGGRNAGTVEWMNPTTYDTKDLGSRVFPLYPHVYATADHRYFFAGAGTSTNSATTHKPGFWDPTTNKFVAVTGLTVPRQRGGAASCRIGDVRNQDLVVLGGGWPATASTNIIKMSGNTAKFRADPNLPAAKSYVGCVGLPDGSVLELHGGTANKIANSSNSVSLLTSANATSWTPMNPKPAGGDHRLYHNVAFLMDDGSVVSAFSNPSGEARSNTVLRYEPPYLFKGPRPTISSIPAAMTYGKTYTISVSTNTRKVTLVTSASPTHTMDVNQKQVTLPVVNGKITLNFNSYQFGRAYVRVFAISDKGVPSVAKWSRIQ